MVGLVVGLLGCEQRDTRLLVGQPARPYHLELTLEPAAPRAGQETQLRFRLLDAAGGQALSPLQILHERALHTFIVSRDLRVFAHTHHEDFFPLTDQDLRAASFHFPHVFPTAGEYMIVSEFTYRDRSWLKQFRVPVSGASAPEGAGGRRTGPEPGQSLWPVSGQPAQLARSTGCRPRGRAGVCLQPRRDTGDRPGAVFGH